MSLWLAMRVSHPLIESPIVIVTSLFAAHLIKSQLNDTNKQLIILPMNDSFKIKLASVSTDRASHNTVFAKIPIPR